MNNDLQIALEFTPLILLDRINTDVDALWIHLSSPVRTETIEAIIGDSSVSDGISIIMTSGYNNEFCHDLFDDLVESIERDHLILTVWSEDSFSDSLWEFLNLYASRPYVKIAKILIVVESMAEQMKLIAEVSTALQGFPEAKLPGQ